MLVIVSFRTKWTLNTYCFHIVTLTSGNIEMNLSISYKSGTAKNKKKVYPTSLPKENKWYDNNDNNRIFLLMKKVSPSFQKLFFDQNLFVY